MTKLLYLHDFSLITCESEVVDALHEEGRDIVILDQTVFYPQGGGQPYDKGVIENSNSKFIVEEVRFIDGLVKHTGHFEKGSFVKGDKVVCLVDEQRRSLNSRLHSAGHIVDMAIHEIKLDWIPGKGFHFPEGPYVEYAGSLEGVDPDLIGVDTEKLKIDVETLCNKFITHGMDVKIEFMDQDQMKKVCHFVPDYIPEGKPGRVILFGDFGVPCGGTHVSNLSQIKNMTIRKIKNNGGSIRVGYDVVG